MATIPKRPLTLEEKEDTNRLKAAWELYKQKNVGATQEWLAKETGLGAQSVIGQYLNGIIQLNLKSLLAICNAIDTNAAEISPSLTRHMLISSEEAGAMNRIGERLKEARKNKGLSQQELANKAGVSQGAIGNYESGVRSSSVSVAEIAKILDVSALWLETGKGDKNPLVPIGRNLTSAEEEWLSLLDALGTDDIEEFSRLISDRQTRNRRLLHQFKND